MKTLPIVLTSMVSSLPDTPWLAVLSFDTSIVYSLGQAPSPCCGCTVPPTGKLQSDAL